MQARIGWMMTVFISSVWFINGAWAKLLGAVPRHQQIVAAILGPAHAPLLTTLIGLGEVVMALWVLSRWQMRLCTWLQVLLVAIMNGLEAWLVKPLLLFGYFNLLWAALFIGVVLLHQEFLQRSNSTTT